MLLPNPDLLHCASRYRPDGRTKDPHAHHRAEHLAQLQAKRRARWAARLARLFQALTRSRTTPTLPCPALPLGANTQDS